MTAATPRELKLQRLVEAGVLLHQALSLDMLLQRLVEVGAHLLEARYAALGVLAPDGVTLEQFITTGLTPEQKEAIGPLPTGKGLLGAMLSEGRPLRIPHLNQDARSVGFPDHHPPMDSFLGVPILWRGQVFGRLYCTDKLTAPAFTAEDEEMATLLAAQAAIAIENANLYAQAQAASRLKSEFLANMSHELRTPMNAILGFSELVQNGALGPVSPPQTEALGRVLRNARHLLELIDDVLDLAKIEAGKLEVVYRPFAPRAVLEAAATTVGPAAAAKGLVLDVSLGALPAVLHGDEGKVRQIVLNLLSNAVKFTDAGTVTLTAAVRDDGWSVTVADTGTGIRPADLGLIFEAFRQADASTARHAGGTGLGLAISRKMADLMNGTLDVDSVVGVGSVFTLALPLSTVLTATAEERVLLAIDDDPDVLALIAHRLAGTEFTVVTALGGENGLKAAHARRPDVITLDLLMPGGLDGWEVLRRLKASPALATVPVVMMSIVEDRATAFGMGAAECLVKPVSRDTLIGVLRRHRAPGCRVLVVDDDPDARALVTSVLTAAGYETVEAESGEAALAAIAISPPALVVLDLMMPGLDGFAVIERLSRTPETRAIPVVVLTAMALSPADEARLSQGAAKVLRKAAMSPDALLGDLREMLARV